MQNVETQTVYLRIVLRKKVLKNPFINQKHWCWMSCTFPRKRVKSFALTTRILRPGSSKRCQLTAYEDLLSRTCVSCIHGDVVVSLVFLCLVHVFLSSRDPRSKFLESGITLWLLVYIRACGSKEQLGAGRASKRGMTDVHCHARFEWNARKGHPFLLRLPACNADVFSHTR